MNNSAIERLKKFIPSIKGISEANQQGLIALAQAIEAEQLERESAAKFALEFYADERRYSSPNAPTFECDPYTEHFAPYMQDVTRDWGDFARCALRTLK